MPLQKRISINCFENEIREKDLRLFIVFGAPRGPGVNLREIVGESLVVILRYRYSGES